MTETDVITQHHWNRTARRVERETLTRHGSSSPPQVSPPTPDT